MFRWTLRASFFVCCSVRSGAVSSLYYLVCTIYCIEWLDDDELQMGTNVHVVLQSTILAPAWRNWRNSWKTSEYSVNMSSPKYMSDVLLLEPTCSVNLTCKICDKLRNVLYNLVWKSEKRSHAEKSQQEGVNWTELAQDRVSLWPLVTRLLNIYFCNSRTFPKQMSTAVM
jgi:hypothetical protein